MRAGRILLGEASLTALGLVGRRPTRSLDRRIEKAGSLAAYDVLVSDDLDTPDEQIEAALDASVSCVLWSDGVEAERFHQRFIAAGRTLLVGANLAHGLAPSLAAHEAAVIEETPADAVLGAEVAWTEPGRALRRGEAMPFPEPVGPRWATLQPHTGRVRRFVAPVEGQWAAAMARVTVGTSDGVHVRVLGVADHAAHLEALSLAAGAVAIGEYPYGLATPEDRAEYYLAAAVEAGLDVAAYTTTR